MPKPELKRFFNVRLTSPQEVSAFLEIAQECQVKAIPTSKGLLYVVKGEAMCRIFAERVRDLVGFTGYREFPVSPCGSTDHARDVADFFKTKKKTGKK